MSKPSEITLQQFNDYKASAETAFLTTIQWLEEKVGMPVLSLHMDEEDDESFLCNLTFGPPFAESEGTEEKEEPEAE